MQTALTSKRAVILAMMPLALVVLILWAMMAHRVNAGPFAPTAVESAAVLLAFFVTFTALSLNLVGRLAAVTTGAIICLLLGSLLNFYFPPDALHYLWDRRQPLFLLAGISLVTQLLQHGGLFEHLAYRLICSSKGSPRQMMIQLCLVTYVLSMFLNNLTTILVLIPLSLRIATSLKIDPLPLVLGEIIASNLGGASTMVGDFPNMLIASEANIGFLPFLTHLMPFCILLMGITTAVLSRQYPGAPASAAQFHLLLKQSRPAALNPLVARRGLLITGGMLIGFLLSGVTGISPGVVAFLAGHLALFFGGLPLRTLVMHSTWNDIFFFICIFLMVGAVSASGILDGLGTTAGEIWQSSPTWGVLALAWGAALLTCVFNAGPTTALIIHMIPASMAGMSGDVIWWALSLGVCAGSSGTLTGATAGPVAATLLEQRGYQLTFNRFARTGMPVMLLMLLLSSIYLVFLSA